VSTSRDWWYRDDLMGGVLCCDLGARKIEGRESENVVCETRSGDGDIVMTGRSRSSVVKPRSSGLRAGTGTVDDT
jgi:hypothetical protein